MKKGDGYILGAAFIWGFALSGQASGMEYMGPLSFTAVRLFLGAISMLPLIIILDKKKKINTISDFKSCLKPSIMVSPFFISPIICQQVGLQYTTVGKCAFITALYIFIVPLLGMIFGEKVSKRTWILILIALLGLYLITMPKDSFEFNRGDLIVLGAAFTYSIQIIQVSKLGNIDTIKFSTLLFLFGSIISFILSLIFERGDITWLNITRTIWPIVITGIISCAVGYTLQFVGLTKLSEKRASLLLSSETVFSLISGILILHESYSMIEYIGCAFMIVAIIFEVKNKDD